MERIQKKWYLAALGTIALTVISDRVSDQTKDIPVLKYIVNFFQWIYNIGARVLLYDLKIWVILLAVLIIYFFKRILRAVKKDNKPAMLGYTSDIIKEWLWKWNYSVNSSGQYEMSYLTAYCKDCEVELRIDYSYRTARCPNCGKEFEEKGSYKTYSDNGKVKGQWEDYKDTEHIVRAKANKLLTKIA